MTHKLGYTSSIDYTDEEEEEWKRIDVIGQNGNDGLHYDNVDHPKHYTSHASGVECITITECFNFCRGNAIKYIWRAGEKGDEIEDLKKAKWYIEREISRLQRLR